MDIKKIIDLLNNSNIDSDKIQNLIKEATSLDLNDEENIRYLIRKSSDITNRSIPKELEDRIIEVLKEKGISKELFSKLK